MGSTTVALAAYGMYQARKEALPLRHLVAMAGIAVIGIGSFAYVTSFYSASARLLIPEPTASTALSNTNISY